MIAVVSDIHGNLGALEAVLEEIDRRGIKQVVNLGDCLYGPLDPAGTAQLLMSRAWPTVAGNEDHLLIDPTEEQAAESPSLSYVIARLSDETRTWLRSLPPLTTAFGRLLMFHGSPDNDHLYFLRRIEPDGARMRTIEELAADLTGYRQPVILCGHDHLPYQTRLSDRRLILNPGSVGLPSYSDHLPYPHRMEAGSPDARFAVLEESDEGWRAELVAVGYDYETAARMAAKNGRDDWAEWLRTGRARRM